MKYYINLQGVVMSEPEAKQYYGIRFETAILEQVELDKDGDWVAA